MILIRPSVELECITPQALKIIEAAGRTCYKSEDKVAPGSAEQFIRMILRRGHESVIEHASATIRVICDRGVSHELVRHRIMSYSQESTRYCDYGTGNITFIIPPWVDIKPGVYGHSEPGDDTVSGLWFETMQDAELVYCELRIRGCRPEEARSILPNSLKTELVITANLREWRHFFKLRTSPAAHPQMREVAVKALVLLRAAVPIIFDDILGGAVDEKSKDWPA